MEMGDDRMSISFDQKKRGCLFGMWESDLCVTETSS